jgi:methoxymalonate biosynthesis protein
LPEFSPPVVTADSRDRRRMHQAGFRRHAEREGFEGADEDFLRTLDLDLRIDGGRLPVRGFRRVRLG